MANAPITGVNLTQGIQGGSKAQNSAAATLPSKGNGASFGDLVKGMAVETVESSKAADQASIQAASGTISDLELVQIMNEAEISLQRFQSVYERTKESFEKILNMQI